MNRLIIWIAFAILPASTLAEERQCRLAIVEWQDAVFSDRTGQFNPDDMLAPSVAFGCVLVTEKTVSIVHSFQNGHPDGVLVVPFSWIVKITPLSSVPQPAPAPPTETKRKSWWRLLP